MWLTCDASSLQALDPLSLCCSPIRTASEDQQVALRPAQWPPKDEQLKRHK